MELKLGQIYKIAGKRYEKEIEFRGVLIKQRECYDKTLMYNFITTKGSYEEVNSEHILKISSTNMQNDLRTALKNVYKQESERQKLEDKMKAMESELRGKRQDITKQCLALKEISGEYTLSDIAREFSHMNASTENNQTFSFSIERYVTKYATPTQYSFLHTEYDGCLFIDDHDACIKECGFEIRSSAIENLKRLLQYTTLQTVEDGAYLGDKNTLHTQKIFRFKLKKHLVYQDIIKECKNIQQWAEQQQQQQAIYNV